MARANDNGARLKEATEMMDFILERITGLSELDRKIVAYYTLSTHSVRAAHTFPLLVLLGPTGTGKSITLHVIRDFAYRPDAFSLRGRTLPTIRDELVACHDGTAIIEESDRAWSGSESFEAMLSDRYQRATAQAALKEPVGDRGYETVDKTFFGATVLHRRYPFEDAALDGRSILVHFRADHSREYDELEDFDPLLADARKLVGRLVFELPEVARLRGVAGRIFATHKLLFAVAQVGEDETFRQQLQERVLSETDQLKETQSVEPVGLVVRALIDCLSGPGGKPDFHHVRIRDLRASIWDNYRIELQPRQIGAIARQVGFETKNSHGFRVVAPTPATLLQACEEVGYEDEAIATLRAQMQKNKKE